MSNSTITSFASQTHDEVKRAARALSIGKRQEIIMGFPETELHVYLKELFQSIDPHYLVEITHGTNELGKDLVLVRRNSLTTDVIGVVVKCGDISGQTMGEVDNLKEHVEEVQKLSAKNEHTVREIESQIQQAKEHPAELKSIFQKLPVNKIMVILAGKLSGNARTRIERELKLGDKVRDIEWLYKQFTEHYPQVFFAGRCIDFLQKEIERLETGDWLVKSEKNLSEWWVEPVVSTVDIPMSFDAESLEALWQQEQFPFAGLNKILKQGNHVILVGDPGSGKSAAMSKFSLNMLREAYTRATRHKDKKNVSEPQALAVPILVTARDIYESDNASELKNNYFGGGELAGQFNAEVLLVDGLDEISSSSRQRTLEKAGDFAKSLGCALVVTSRKVEILRETPKGFRKYELMPFEMGQALKLFEKLLTDDPLLSSLQEGLRKIQDQIPLTPLSLVLLLEVASEHREIPSSITELYDRFFDMVLGRYESKKGIEVLFEPLIKRRFMASLAYHEFYLKGRLEITQEDFDAACKKYASEFGYDTNKLHEFISEIDRAGILVMRDVVEFKHRSFLDYFVSSWLLDNAEEITDLNGLLTNIYFNDLWSDVTFFYVGLKRRITLPLLESILAYSKDTLTGYADKLLSGRLLQAGWHSEASIKNFGVNNAFSFAPKIKSQLKEIAEKSGGRVPTIVTDYMVMVMVENSLRSGHLSEQLKMMLKNLLRPDTDLDIRMLPAVLWAVHPFLDKNELDLAIDNSLKTISRPGVLEPAEEVAALILMRNLKTPNKDLTKSIERQMNRLQRKYPKVFQDTLPQRRKGFRPRKPPQRVSGS